MFKIGIICAGDSEAEPFIKAIENYTVSEKAMLKFYSGTLENIDVATLFCGVCKTNAAIATQILIDTYGCNIIVNSGTAGAMSPNLQLFDTIISTEAAYWDVAEDILTDFHPWVPSVFWQADEALIDIFKNIVDKNHLHDVYFGRIVTGEMFIENRFRERINENFSPLAVDMETASIAHVCYVNRIPYIAVRTITDTPAKAGIDVFEANCEKASQISANIVRLLLKQLAVQDN